MRERTSNGGSYEEIINRSNAWNCSLLGDGEILRSKGLLTLVEYILTVYKENLTSE